MYKTFAQTIYTHERVKKDIFGPNLNTGQKILNLNLVKQLHKKIYINTTSI